MVLPTGPVRSVGLTAGNENLSKVGPYIKGLGAWPPRYTRTQQRTERGSAQIIGSENSSFQA